jgi:hypothetical protein
MQGVTRPQHSWSMTRGGSYAVRWRGESAETRAGKLELRVASFRLEGGSPNSRRSVESVRYADLDRVRMAARAEDRIDGRPTILLERRWSSLPLAIASLDGLGTVWELFERLSAEAAAILPA